MKFFIGLIYWSEIIKVQYYLMITHYFRDFDITTQQKINVQGRISHLRF